MSRKVSILTAAEMNDVSVATIRRRISDGTLKASRLGRVIRIDTEDLERAFKPVEPVVSRD